MRINRDSLIRIARETVQQRTFSDPALVAAYLTGSLRTDNPFLGGATDIDIVFVHAGQPAVRREVIAVSPEVHLDIVHNPRSEYEHPKQLRLHPWLGPQLYDPLPLHVSQHFFEFVQAGVRDKFYEPANVIARAQTNLLHARQLWGGLETFSEPGPALLLSYLKSVSHAANAVAVLNGLPLSERRFLLQFPSLAQAAGKPGLSDPLLAMLGAREVDLEALQACLPAWEQDFTRAAIIPGGDPRLAMPRLNYYLLAFRSLLASESPHALLWPLLLTWTHAALVLPPEGRATWNSVCKGLGLLGPGFAEKHAALDGFLDEVEELLENTPQ